MPDNAMQSVAGGGQVGEVRTAADDAACGVLAHHADPQICEILGGAVGECERRDGAVEWFLTAYSDSRTANSGREVRGSPWLLMDREGLD